MFTNKYTASALSCRTISPRWGWWAKTTSWVGETWQPRPRCCRLSGMESSSASHLRWFRDVPTNQPMLEMVFSFACVYKSMPLSCLFVSRLLGVKMKCILCGFWASVYTLYFVMLCHAELLTGRSIRLKDQRRLICKAMRLITQAGYQNTAKVMILLQHGCYCMIFCWKSKLASLTITIVGPRACDQFEVPHILSKQDFKWMQMNPKWMQHCATHRATQRLSSPFFAKRRRPIVNVATLPTWCLTRGFGVQNFAALGKAGAMMDGGYVFCFT